ncbi:MAG: acetate--CoA ligase family protein [Bacillota bacterium]|nr:acetate--CoA ligase family protein [Bacillota bacterium]
MAEKWRTDLKSLLAPQIIAVVGATEKPSASQEAIRALLDMGFTGRLYPINPKYPSIFGLPCYPSLKDLPETPEMVTICLPAHAVNGVLEQMGEIGCHAATVFASGFSEAGPEGAELQRQMTEIAEAHQINICGPNCLGHIDRINRTGSYYASYPTQCKEGSIAVVSQSGSMAIAMFQCLYNLGISHVISYGNQAVTTLPDYLYYLADDPHTRVITTFIEGVNNGAAFRDAVDYCRAKNKAIVAIKIGKSAISQRVALAHTAALVGSNAVYESLFTEHGIMEVSDMDEMVQTVIAIVKSKPITCSGRKVVTMAVSGGQCGIIGDIAEEIGLPMGALSAQTTKNIEAIVPDYITVKNPLDVGILGQKDYREYRDVLRHLANDPEIGLIAVSQDAPNDLVEFYPNVIQAIAEVSRDANKPIITFTNHSSPANPGVMQQLLDENLPLLQGTREALVAIKHLLTFNTPPVQQVNAVQEPCCTAVNWAQVSQFLKEAAEAQTSLSERESKDILRLLDIPVTADIICRSEEEVATAWKRIKGKAALKIVSPDILHKTDVGGVVLDIGDEATLVASYLNMLETVKQKSPTAKIDGVSVQEMAPEGVDLIIGMNRDPQFGPVIVFGLGGIYVEVFKDSSLSLLPLSRAKARQMIINSRSYRLMGEVRGRAALDIEPLVDILLKIAALTEYHGDMIREIDLNPVRIGSFGTMVLDALFVLNRK